MTNSLSSTVAPELNADEESVDHQTGTTLEMSVLRSLIVIARRKLGVCGTAGVGLAIGLTVSLLMPVEYTATTRILTPQQTPSSAALMMNQMSASGAASLATVAGGGFGLKNPNDIYIGMLTSRTVLDAIIEKFRLREVYSTRNTTDARRKLSARTKISSERSGFIAVEVTDRDKSRAAEMANSFTEQLREVSKSLALTEASQRRFFYEEQLKRAKDDLINAEVAFRKIQESKGLVQLDAQAKAMILNAAALRAEIAAKQVEIETLRTYSTERNPGLQLAASQLSSMQAEAERMEQHGRTQGSSGAGLQDVAGAGAEYLNAEHNFQYRQIMFDILLKQYDAARLDEGKYAAIIQVVEPAIPPERRSSPHRFLIMLSFTLLGFTGACLWIVMSNVIENSPYLSHTAAEFKRALMSR